MTPYVTTRAHKLSAMVTAPWGVEGVHFTADLQITQRKISESCFVKQVTFTFGDRLKDLVTLVKSCEVLYIRIANVNSCEAIEPSCTQIVLMLAIHSSTPPARKIPSNLTG